MCFVLRTECCLISAELDRLALLVGEQLPGSFLEVQELPRSAGLKLALINPDFDDRGLSQVLKNRLMDDPPYWVLCWASGHVQAELLAQEEICIRGKTVVDFGSGCGVGAIAAKLAGASRVYALDIDPVAHEVIRVNSALNDVEVFVVSDMSEIDQKVDLLMAADVLYEAKMYPLLDYFLTCCVNVLVTDSRLKTMPNPQYHLWKKVDSFSFPDFQEAKEFNSVNVYTAGNWL